LSNKPGEGSSKDNSDPAPGRGSRNADAPAWPSGDIWANGIRLHYYRTGGNKPPLVLVHGFADDGLCWTSVARALERSYDVVMVDARGHGRSQAPARGYGPLDNADDLAGVIAGLKLPHPIVLGHSMGAMTVLVLAGRHPDLPGAVLLEDPPAWWMKDFPPPFTAQWHAQSKEWIAGFRRHSRMEIVAAQRREAPNWPEEDLIPWADSKTRLSLSIFHQDVLPEMDWPRLLRGILCPVLLLTADPERGAIVTDAQAASLRAMVPHLSIAHIAGAGHNIHRDQSARFLEVVRAFMEELPSVNFGSSS
jgi:pimeloyl-ACP methyl ester carboxylesterase